MTIVVECGNCGRRSGAKEEWIGKSVKCPGCGEKVLITGAAAPAAPQTPQQPPSRPAAKQPGREAPSPPAAKPVERPAGAPQSARRPPAARAVPSSPRPAAAVRPQQPATAMPAQGAAPPLGGDMMDLLGGDFAAGPAGFDPMSGGALGGALGAPPAPRRRKGSNKNLFIILALVAAGVMFLLCGGIALVIVPPAIQAARRAAAEAQVRNASGQQSASRSPFSFGQSSAPSAIWGPDPQFTAQLPMRVTFDRYSMQLPQGFSLEPTPPNPVKMGVRSQTFVWAGPAMPTGVRSVIEVDVAQIPAGQKAKPDELSTALPSIFNSLKTNAQILGLQHDRGERGQIAGRECIRAKFSGTMVTTQMGGILYVVLEGGDRLIMLYCLSPAGCTDPPRDVLEASFLTLQ